MPEFPDCSSLACGRLNPLGRRLGVAFYGFFLILLLLVAPAQAQDVPEPLGAAAQVVVASAEEDEACTDSTTVMCLLGGRYAVTIDYSTKNGDGGSAKVARPRTADSGLFYFFSPNNWEVLIKVLDGCPINEHHWVYAASATDVGLRFVIRDTVTDMEKVYTKDPGEAARAITDAGAFPMGCEA